MKTQGNSQNRRKQKIAGKPSSAIFLAENLCRSSTMLQSQVRATNSSWVNWSELKRGSGVFLEGRQEDSSFLFEGRAACSHIHQYKQNTNSNTNRNGPDLQLNLIKLPSHQIFIDHVLCYAIPQNFIVSAYYLHSQSNGKVAQESTKLSNTKK